MIENPCPYSDTCGKHQENYTCDDEEDKTYCGLYRFMRDQHETM
jgi:hypothetical protein